MELGIEGKNAIICASSKGLGRGCAFALAEEGVNVVINGRNREEVEATARELRALTKVDVTEVVADVTTAEGRAALLDACPQPDMLVTNAGGPPALDFRKLGEKEWLAGLIPNLVAPVLLIKEVIDGMTERRFGRSVKTPLVHLPLSNAARAGLTGFIGGLSRQVARHNVIVNNLLPGPFATDRQMGQIRTKAAELKMAADEYLQSQHAQVPVGRFGTPEEFGRACAYLCSVHAEYIVGQNLLMDGGGFYSTL